MSNKPKGLPAEIPLIRQERTHKEKHRTQRDASGLKRAQAKPTRDGQHQQRWAGRDEQVSRILYSLHGVKPARQPIWVAAARLHWRLGLGLDDIRDAILSIYRRSRKAKVLVYKALKDVSRRQRKEDREWEHRKFEDLKWESAVPEKWESGFDPERDDPDHDPQEGLLYDYVSPEEEEAWEKATDEEKYGLTKTELKGLGSGMDLDTAWQIVGNSDSPGYLKRTAAAVIGADKRRRGLPTKKEERAQKAMARRLTKEANLSLGRKTN